MFILRNKTADELQSERGFGTHKLINVKARHLGRDIAGAVNLVTMNDGTARKNFVNLECNNFYITEKGDLRDIIASQDSNSTVEDRNNGTEDIPELG